MKSAPVLITGADGRLGRVLQGVGFDRNLVGLTGPRGAVPARVLDVTSRDATFAVVDAIRPRAIIHLASLVGSACELDPDGAEGVNVAGSANIIAAADALGVERVVFASTAAVYGDHRRHPVLEDEEPAPTGVYASTKLRAETVLADSAGSVAVDAMRVFNIYGPGMADSLVDRLLRATKDAPVRLNGMDGFVRDYVHVEDVARALLCAVDSTGSGFRILNVGSGIARSNRDLLDSLDMSASDSVQVGPEVHSYSSADISAIERELGWRPVVLWPPSSAMQP